MIQQEYDPTRAEKARQVKVYPHELLDICPELVDAYLRGELEDDHRPPFSTPPGKQEGEHNASNEP